MIWGLWAESPKRVSRTVQTLFRTGGNSLKRGFALCKRLFWDSRSRGQKTPFAPSLKHFWAFWLFRRLYQASGVATHVKSMPTETKGRFCKRLVLANIPSFRFSFRGNMRTCPRSGFRSGGTSECTLVPVFVPGEHLPKQPFWKTTLLSTPEMLSILSIAS